MAYIINNRAEKTDKNEKELNSENDFAYQKNKLIMFSFSIYSDQGQN